MVVHPLAVSYVCTFVDGFAEWVEASWNTSIDIPFIIISKEERMIIIDLCCQMWVLVGNPILRTDLVIGSTLNHGGVTEAISLQRRDAALQEGSEMAQHCELDGDKASTCVMESSSPLRRKAQIKPQREKCKVDWTMALGNITLKWRWRDDVA